jgi:hypothetical protein
MGGEGSPDASLPDGLPAFCAHYPRPTPQGGWESSIVSYGTDGKLVYQTDGEGNRVPDFSYAGYQYGAEPPVVPEVLRIDAPGGGDDTKKIQDGIDQVGQKPLGADGFRGALVLGPGTYKLNGVVTVNHDGVVLRGSGHGADPGKDTILLTPTGKVDARLVLGAGRATGWSAVAGSSVNVTTKFVGVGSRTLDVAEASKFAVGDNVIVVHPITAAWLKAVNYGETYADPPWTTGEGPITFNRRVAAKNGNTLTLDAPIFNHLDAALTQASVYKADRGGIVTHVGIENLRVDSQYGNPTDENHPNDSLLVLGTEDAWVSDVTTLHFVYAGVNVGNSVRVTIKNSEALDPIGVRDFGRMYNFALDDNAQLVLFSGCHARAGRHHYVDNGRWNASGDVFYRSISEGDSTSEGHRHWGQGLLWDNIDEVSGGIEHVGCRGAEGSSHGWASVHSVLWNVEYSGGRGSVEKPPTAQNYAFGAGPYIGPFGLCPTAVAGHIEQNAGELRQESLYEAQLCDRLRP